MLKTFYGFLARKKGLFLVVLSFVVVGAILQGITPYFYKLFIDALPNNNYSELFNILLLYLAVQIIGMLINMLSYQLGDIVLIDSASNARKTIFSYIQDLDFAFHTSKSTGSLISAIKRGDGSFFSLYHILHFRILNVFVHFLVMLYFFNSLDPRITLITLVAMGLILLSARLVVRYNINTRRKFVDSEDDVSAVIVDNMINYETVKIFAKEIWERKRLDKVFRPWKKYLWRYGMSFRFFDVTVGTLIIFAGFFTFLFGINLTTNGEITTGEFVLIAGFISSFYPRIYDLVFALRDIAKNYADIIRYFGMLDNKVAVLDPKKPIQKESVKGEIEFKKVNHSYVDGQKNALRNVNLKIRQGQSVALVGRSGSGKTTIIKALMRFFDIEKGRITIDGTDISRFAKSNLRSFMGIVPQEPILFNNTIGYNIKYGNPNATQKELVAASKQAHIHELIKSMPKGYKTQVGERGIKLSGGQKQRVAIARMILSDPDIILFDEATSHLDSESEALIQDAFWKASKNKTTIIIAHRLSTVLRADKIVVMDKGKIIETGTHGELVNNSKSLYKHLWNLQTKEK